MVPDTAFAYLRVSTRKQDVENQRLQITNYAKSHNFIVKDEDWYIDDAISGTVAPMQREHFSDMMGVLEGMAADGNAPKRLCVYEISRLGRNLWEILGAIQLIEKYTMLVSTSPKETFFTLEDRSLRNLIILIISWATDREHELLVQRVNDGMEKAKFEGRHSGNIPLGYTQHLCHDEGGESCLTGGKPFVIRKAIGSGKCEDHGLLSLSQDGKTTLEMLQANPKLKPRHLRGLTDTENDYQRFALIRNVKKYTLSG